MTSRGGTVWASANLRPGGARLPPLFGLATNGSGSGLTAVDEPDSLEGALADIAQPVRDPRVEAHRFALIERERLGADDDLDRSLEDVAVLVAFVADHVPAAGRRGAQGIGDLHEVDGVLRGRGEALPGHALGHGEERAMGWMHDRDPVRVLRGAPGVARVPVPVDALAPAAVGLGARGPRRTRSLAARIEQLVDRHVEEPRERVQRGNRGL